jgi:hypothetical protein
VLVTVAYGRSVAAAALLFAHAWVLLAVDQSVDSHDKLVGVNVNDGLAKFIVTMPEAIATSSE